MKNADTPAAACTIEPHPDSIAQAVGCGAPVPQRKVYTGLTKREAFEMAAMQGLLSNYAIIDNHDKEGIEWITKHARSQADAMLKEHDK